MFNKNKIPNVDLYVSPIGIGSVKFGRNSAVKYPNSFQLPTDREIKDLFALAKELGINVIDTAPAYGNAEHRIGENLDFRNDWVITTKIGEIFSNGKSTFDFSEKAILKSIDSSLYKLKTDSLDIVLIHSDGNDCDILKNTECVNILTKLKEKGVVKAIGISGKTKEGGILALNEMGMDIAMITHNILYQDEQSVIDFAAKNKKSIFLKKIFSSGHLDLLGDEPVQKTMDFIFKENISSVILGTINKKHLIENCNAAYKSINLYNKI